jgi:carbonic anhydrase
MDNRKRLRIPENFAYIIRTGGANMRNCDFIISYAIAVGGVNSFALIGHTDCGMVNLASRKDAFIKGLVKRAGWNYNEAEEQFMHFSPALDIVNEVDFILKEVKGFRSHYPGLNVVPLLYRVEDHFLYLIDENSIA